MTLLSYCCERSPMSCGVTTATATGIDGRSAWIWVSFNKSILSKWEDKLVSPPRVKETFFLFSFFFIGIDVPDVVLAPSERIFLEGAVSKGHWRWPSYIHSTILFILTCVCNSDIWFSHLGLNRDKPDSHTLLLELSIQVQFTWSLDDNLTSHFRVSHFGRQFFWTRSKCISQTFFSLSPCQHKCQAWYYPRHTNPPSSRWENW